MKQETHNNIILQPGDRGSRVSAIQKFLISNGEKVIPDGIFGRNLSSILEKIQFENKLPVTGILDHETLNFFEKFSYKGINDLIKALNYNSPLKDADEKVSPEKVEPPKNNPPKKRKDNSQQKNYDIKTKLHKDSYSVEDSLDYRHYATVIAEIIKGEGSEPPVTIAIIAPWGQGKTTLMRFIEKEFKDEKPTPPKDNENHFDKPKALFKDFFKWLKDEKSTLPKDKLKYPTIWFNPWNYHNTEQVWSGLAHTIIKELSQKLDSLQREEFWLRLRLNRINKQSLKFEFQKLIFLKFLPLIIPFLVVFFAGIILMASEGWTYSVIPIFSIIGSISTYVWGRKNELSKPLEGIFRDCIKEIDYEKNSGYFLQVNNDICNCFNMLVGKEKPAIIFIDDLDRCHPEKVKEVIEAINIIINSEVGESCYFIIGMDAQMVAASLEDSYKSLKGRFIETENRLGSIGWYFLDKFIQLPFFIPSISEDKKKEFLCGLFDPGYTALNANGNIDNSEVQKIANEMSNNNIQAIDKELYKKNTEAVDKEFLKVQYSSDNNEIHKKISEYSEYLRESPRGLKRFSNLVRFHHAYQKLRKLKKETLEIPMEHASIDSLCKYMIINLRWPQLVRWIQWEKEEKLINSAIPLLKAEALDDLVENFIKETKDNLNKKTPEENLEMNFIKWKQKVKDHIHIPWIADKDLFQILCYFPDKKSSIANAVNCNVW